MRKFILYGAGLVVVAFVVGLLLFLTFENAASGRAIYANRFGVYSVTGTASLLVNMGVLGIAASLVIFILYLFSRHSLLLKSYKVICAASGVCIFIGLAWGSA